MTGCAPFYGDSYDDVVERNLKGDLNYNFEEINLKFEDSTIHLLKSLLQKKPKDRISASECLKHEAFKGIVEEVDYIEDNDTAESTTVHNLKEFHQK